MHAAHRTHLSLADVTAAMKLFHTPPIYGYTNTNITMTAVADTDGAAPATTESHNDGALWFVPSTTLTIADVLAETIPPPPPDTTISVHWLAIEGKLVRIPQNVTDDITDDTTTNNNSTTTTATVAIKPLQSSILSKEMSTYYDRITQSFLSRDDDIRRAAYDSLLNTNNLQQVIPFLILFINTTLINHLTQCHITDSLILMIEALLSSTSIHLDSYIHQLLPAVMTCILSAKLSDELVSDHWAVRHHASRVLVMILRMFDMPYPTLRSRVTKTLARALLDTDRSLTTHYGAIIALTDIGHTAVQNVIVPYINAYMTLLTPLLTGAVATSDMIRCDEAFHVRSALLHAIGIFVQTLIRQTSSFTEPQQPNIKLYQVSGSAHDESNVHDTTAANNAAAAPMMIDGQHNGTQTQAAATNTSTSRSKRKSKAAATPTTTVPTASARSSAGRPATPVTSSSTSSTSTVHLHAISSRTPVDFDTLPLTLYDMNETFGPSLLPYVISAQTRSTYDMNSTAGFALKECFI